MPRELWKPSTRNSTRTCRVKRQFQISDETDVALHQTRILLRDPPVVYPTYPSSSGVTGFASPLFCRRPCPSCCVPLLAVSPVLDPSIPLQPQSENQPPCTISAPLSARLHTLVVASVYQRQAASFILEMFTGYVSPKHCIELAAIHNVENLIESLRIPAILIAQGNPASGQMHCSYRVFKLHRG